MWQGREMGLMQSCRDAEASEYALDFKESVVAMVSKHGQEEKDQSVS